jgi:hypothetical protein
MRRRFSAVLVGTALSQLVKNLATKLLQTHLVDKLLEQHCHNLLTSLLVATRLLRRHLVQNLLEHHCHNLQRCNLTLGRLPGSSEYHDAQVNVLSHLPDWEVALPQKGGHL